MSDSIKLNNDELEKVSGGVGQNLSDSNGAIVFEKGKWVQLPQDPTYAYKLVELTDSNLIVDAWNRYNRSEHEFERGYIIKCTRNHTLPIIMLHLLVEIDKPDWVNE